MSDNRQAEPCLIYPEVSDHFDHVRQHSRLYDEAPATDRSYEDTEASFVQGAPQTSAVRMEEEDLFSVKLAEKENHLHRWQNKLRKCSCCVRIVSFVFMVMAGWHLMAPPRFEDMLMMHGGPGHQGMHRSNEDFNEHGRENFEWEAEHGGRHLRRGEGIPPRPNFFDAVFENMGRPIP